MKPSERTLRGLKKQWYLAGRRLHCGQRWSDYTNVRMRGRHCLEALASPEPERVGSKFLNTHDKSFSPLRGRRRSVGGVTRTPAIDGGESQPFLL